MAQGNVYKPRYTLAHLAKSKIWPYKDSYLRRFYALRGRRLQRGGIFRRCVLVATTRKWTIARRFIRPFMRRVGSTTAAGIGGKTAYGRPTKRRYRDAFYVKQQLRYFHGKIKESAFRYLFQHYQKSLGERKTSFFNVRGSRLDIIFFRRRLLPTIYACHQFIQHHGLHLNGELERSPRAVVRVGDVVAVPSKTWKPLYWDLFCRVYYRRWGLYIFRRRQYTQLKKSLFSFQSRHRQTLFRFLRTRFPLATSVRKFKSRFSYKLAKKKIAYNIPLKAKLGRHSFFTQGVSAFGMTDVGIRRLSRRTKIQLKSSQLAYPARVQKLHLELRPAQKKSLDKQPTANRGSFYKQLATLNEFWVESHLPRNTGESFSKADHLKKVLYALRLRKSLLPSITRLRKNATFSGTSDSTQYDSYYRPFLRNLLLRSSRKRNNKVIRRRKIVRLKAVHFSTPKYLQRDYRTLRTILLQSPSIEDLHYSFRGSLAKVYSFYSARGF